MMKKNSTIRALENKTRKDDINALFQLAQCYKEGEYVDKDIVQAEEYFSKVVKLFQPQSLQIASVKLVDFRGFENISIDFTHQDKSNLSVIIGNNGAGKTALLEAVKKSLSWIIKNMLNQRDSGTGELIDELDINNNSTAEYASIVTQYTIVSGFQCQLELSKAKKNIKSTRKGSYQEIKQLADIYKLANSRDNELNFPIMAYYSIERADEITKKDTQPFDEVSEQNAWDKFDGYNKALNGAADFKFFFRWYKYLEDSSNAIAKQNQKPLTEIAKLQAELDSDLIKERERQASLDDKPDEFLISFKQQKNEALCELKKLIKEDPASNMLKMVTTVIFEFLPEFSNLKIQRQPLAMLIDKKGTTLNIRQLSQGEKSLLALVADIARRLVLLNPSLEDPLQGNGIVLIDEIDLHLHPKWQQSVVPSLLRTFPKIQFIITTHSSQVVTTVDDECIRILRNANVYAAPKGSRGAKSSRLLKRIFEVEVRPPNDSNSMDLAKYKDFVYNDNWEYPEAKELRKKLNQQFGDEEPDLTELDLYIENRIWEIGLEKDQ